jgi:hypothetical protein
VRTLISISALPAESQGARLFRASRREVAAVFVFFPCILYLFFFFAWATALTFVK